MSLPAKYDKRLKSASGFRAAWVPAANVIRIGDIVRRDRDGVFESIGNIKDDFGITFKTRKSDSARVDFTSTGVKERLIQGGAEVDVDQIDVNASATLEITMDRRDSFVLNTDRFRVEEISNELKVARDVKAVDEWNHRSWWIVSGVATGKDVTFIGSQKGKAGLNISGKGKSILDFLTLGLSAGLKRSKMKNLDFKTLNASGPVGLKLIKVRRNGRIVLD